jgi:hypothetical protein
LLAKARFKPITIYFEKHIDGRYEELIVLKSSSGIVAGADIASSHSDVA